MSTTHRVEHMTVEAIKSEILNRLAWEDNLDEDAELGGGSPLEYHYERLQDLEDELKSRAASLIQRLNGNYRIPIKDGLGPAGGEEPDNPLEFVRTFGTPPIQKEAAAEIVSLRETLEAAETALEPFAAFASKAEAFVESRVLAANDVSAIMAPTRDFRLRHFRIARDCLAKIKAALGTGTGT